MFGNGSAFLGLGYDDDEEDTTTVSRKSKRRTLIHHRQRPTSTTTTQKVTLPVRKLQEGTAKTAQELLSERPTRYEMAITVLPVEKMDQLDQVYSGATAITTTAIQATTTMVLLLFSVVVVVPYFAF